MRMRLYVISSLITYLYISTQRDTIVLDVLVYAVLVILCRRSNKVKCKTCMAI